MYMLRSSVKNSKMLNNISKYVLKRRFQETNVHVPLYDPLKMKIFGLWTIYPIRSRRSNNSLLQASLETLLENIKVHLFFVHNFRGLETFSVECEGQFRVCFGFALLFSLTG